MTEKDIGIRRGLYKVFSDGVIELILGNDIKQMCDHLDTSGCNEDVLKKGFSQLINRIFIMAFVTGALVVSVIAVGLFYIVMWGLS
jgi:hypothetical protein